VQKLLKIQQFASIGKQCTRDDVYQGAPSAAAVHVICQPAPLCVAARFIPSPAANTSLSPA